MRLQFIKPVLLFSVFSLFYFLPVTKAEAHAPNVTGQVLTADTNAPVAGVWVKWTDEWDQYRIAQTDANGVFFFGSLGDLDTTQIQNLENTYVDATNDGKNDTPLLSDIDQADVASHFSCGDNPHTFTVIPQNGTNGDFSTINGVILNNGNDTVKIGTIIFTTSTYYISGNVFTDTNKNGLIDTGEVNYQNPFALSISPSGGTIITKSDGSYTISNLQPGTYTISYSSLPPDYYITSPINGPPPSFTVTVGTGNCNTNGAPGASCK